jgi:hypothetical protein
MTASYRELDELMKRSAQEGALMPREDRERLRQLLQELLPDRY